MTTKKIKKRKSSENEQIKTNINSQKVKKEENKFLD